MSLKTSGDHCDQHLRELTRKAETHKIRKKAGTRAGVNTALSTKTIQTYAIQIAQVYYIYI